ncbi:hypothetical protein INS49_009971 [Diaporthe citri]|uniref:uncharacterized protein n=1 Tax=Diaporthe citri TaxID=83186 RepID=UPI001C814348|nr:uncharacterized protein INS49_009971 [Diaporthe citri]KAG6361743.1 hypothetical protein INS49_009971 [Diaporthe citri]
MDGTTKTEETTIFVFGGHVLSQTKRTLDKLVRALVDGPNSKWINDTVAELPGYWDIMASEISEVGSTIPGSQHLADLGSWLKHLDRSSDQAGQDESMPNIVVGPLLVAIQLDQYWRYLQHDRSSKGLSCQEDLQAELVARQKEQKEQRSSRGPRVEVLGFCVGLLGAVAVASSSNRQEFEKYGAVAMRLAMLIGAMIDAREAWDKGLGKGKSVSYATAWRDGKQHEDLTRIVSSLFPEAYISVLFDKARATVTTSERTAPSLVRQLRGAGLTVAEIGIEGHIHAPGPERKRHTNSLVELCCRSPGLQFPEAALMALPTYDNHGDGVPISLDRGDMTKVVLSSILMLQCNWYGTLSTIVVDKAEARLVAFGLDRCIPPTLARRLGSRQQHWEDIEKSTAPGIPHVRHLNMEVQQHQHQQRSLPGEPQPTGAHPATNGTSRSTVNPDEPRPTAQPSNGTSRSTITATSNYPDLKMDRIAVVGMSIKVAGADDLDEFVDMLKMGHSQHELITRDRLQHEILHRENADANPDRRFYANFVRNSDAFDHKFFKKSPRESQAMDPQSRLCLEGAYQAVEQSGYFGESITTAGGSARDKWNVGVYLGNCGVDYEHNIACHPPTPFTATGGLKSFIVGRLSHYFGWTGPSITIDTACSSSTVAIDMACRNLLSGECTAALCGGVNIITNMLWMQNLAAGSFISHTGQCKPFDDEADGYCRAEGMAFVFLKKMADAVADGNPILATIPATAVYQNLNITPLFVPNEPSLSFLFRDVIRQANLTARDISLVEAHGTGTPVGDPAEYDSIRSAIGGPIRDKPLPFGSVKGHVGHTEGASGIIALVKVIMMMRHSFIPAQASFKTLNSAIKAHPDDMMEIVTSLRPWFDNCKIALINNYGACGSNASMVVMQPPSNLAGRRPEHTIQADGSWSRLPLWITGLDVRSIAAYSAKLASWLQLRGGDHEATLADLSFTMSRQSNRALPQGLVFSCDSLTDLKHKLLQTASATKETAESIGIVATKAGRPVVLCFGGQVSTFVGLDRSLHDRVVILRWHLAECDAAITSAGLGLGSIYPDIFSREPQRDTVKLQLMLFAMQYACAKSWMDCGLQGQVSAVVGHSFGEITALCISGVLSLADTIKLVAGRARLVYDAWGADPGAMMAVEADATLVRALLQESNRLSDGSAAVACYNGPSSFTLAGSTKAIEVTAEVLAVDPKFSGIKYKHLNVTNAFHSALVDPLVGGLGDLGKKLKFCKPAIHLEHATESSIASELDCNFVSSHMRKPVFFDHAVHRLAERYPQAIFLEAGSSSTITVMAARALAQDQLSTSPPYLHHFQAISIVNSKKSGLDALTDATISLWRQGLRVTFWPHHARQAQEYAQLLLPPYQFDKSGRHWLEMKSPSVEINKAAEEIVAARALATDYKVVPDQRDPRLLDLFSFVEYRDKKSRKPRFRVNTASEKYQYYFSGHIIAQTAPICPATLESDMAIEALFSLHPEWRAAGLSPVVRDLVNHSPICANHSRVVYIDMDALDEEKVQWSLKMLSVSSSLGNDTQLHVEGRLHFRSLSDPAFTQEFAQYQRLVSHARCQALLGLNALANDQADDIDVLRGSRNVYRAFADIVDYPELYRGVRTVVGHGNESAGIVAKRHQGQTWLDVPLSDSFSQVGGLWVNLMTNAPAGDMYIASGAEMSMRSPVVQTVTDGHENGPALWHVFAQHHRRSDREFTTDLFVFDAATGTMHEVMLGIQYSRVSKESMSRMLMRLTADESVLLKVAKRQNASAPATAATKSVSASANEIMAAGYPVSSARHVADGVSSKPPRKKRSTNEERPPRPTDITDQVRDLVAAVSGIDATEFTLDTEMADLGIDSLMGMELAREVDIVFKCTIDQAEQMEATTLRKFVVCVSNALERAGNGVKMGSNTDDESDEDDESSSSADEGVPKSRSRLENVSTDVSTPEDTENLPPNGKPATPSPKSVVAVEPICATVSNLTLSRSDILESFHEVKMLTDELIRAHHLDTLHKTEIAGSNRLCVALVVEAMEKLGMPLSNSAPGQELERVAFLPQHRRLIECVYRFLEEDARLIDHDVVSGQLLRSHIATPRQSSQEILEGLLDAQPGFAVPNRMTYYAGQSLADVMSGQTDGIRVIFGTPEGRRLVQAMYCEHTFNYMNYLQMRDVIGRLVDRIKRRRPDEQEALKILEMGAGTGGTTMVLAPFLASLAIPVEYTFTDLSPSMVANARRSFGKEYPFMRFAVHDIENPPRDEHKGQHIILASNAVHATRDLVISARNIRQALRLDGFVMILEMTEVVPFVDLVFGLLEGWWLFDDGRNHAVVTAEHWERELHSAGFGHVDWTDGSLPENSFQKVIMALASGPPEAARLPKDDGGATGPGEVRNIIGLDSGDVKAREAEAEALVALYTSGWATPELDAARSQLVDSATRDSPAVVVVTGATGSLGAHIVQSLVEHEGVGTVVCVNRPSSKPVDERQADAFSYRGIELYPSARAKLRVLEADTSRPQLGLASQEYNWLLENGTHIIHNAWPMSGTRPLKAFEPQLQALRNLLSLAGGMALRPRNKTRIGFQFVSSIGVVGNVGVPCALEQRVPMSSVLPGGYPEAKWACERMLYETLHQYPELFRVFVARPGQIAGSTASGCARVMVDLLKIGDPKAGAHSVYHIDNPIGQPWKAMTPVLAAALDIPPHSIIPFKEWIKRVRRSPLSADTDNPAARLVDFFEFHFQRMSCGGLILDTQHAKEHSEIMAKEGPVSAEIARSYVAKWKEIGFLQT